MEDPTRTAAENRATLKLGILAVSALAEGRFRVLTNHALAHVSPAELAGTEPNGVAQWIAAGSFVEPLVTAIVVGGSIAALAVSMFARGLQRRVVAALVSALGVHLAISGPDRAFDGAGVLSWMTLALLSLACAAFLSFALVPLALRLCRPSWSIAWISVVGLASVAHLALLFQRGAPPLHDARVVTAWLVTDDVAAEANGGVRLDALGALQLEPRARLASIDELDAWVVAGDDARLLRGAALDVDAAAPTRVVDAARVQTRRDPSVRSTRDVPNLITIAVDGLRGADLDDRLRSGALPRAIQALAEGGLVYAEVIAPTPDPAANEAALLGGVHPASLGRAPSPRHLAASLAGAGLRTAAFAEGAPRAGVTFGFAEVQVGLGEATVDRALGFLRAHTEERFHLHLSLERLALESSWTDGADDRLAPRPEDDPGLDALRDRALSRLREYATRARRVLDPDPLDVAWGAHLRSAHARRSREVLEDVASLVDEVERLDLAPRTILVLVGTSGIALGEHAHLGYGQDLHMTSVRVPLLVRGPELDEGVRRDGARALIDVAPALAERLGVPWDGPRGALDWLAADAPYLPIHTVTSRGVWNGVSGRTIHGLVDREFLLHWCPEVESEPEALPGFGPWRLYRTDTGDARAVDLALVPRFAAEFESLKGELLERVASQAADRDAAEGRLAPWTLELGRTATK